MSAKIQLEKVSENFRFWAPGRIQQGDVYVGTDRMGTILGSCVCVGFYYPEQGLGAISHITGNGRDQGHCASGALALMENELAKHGVSPADGICFVLGGSGRAETVYSDCLEELAKRGLVPQKLDVLGVYHRKFMFDPSQGYLRLYKRELYKKRAVDGGGEKTCFHDRRERIATGASMLFRNTRLLDALQETILPALTARRADRCHIWCAGCSNGMEVYSIAMVALHHLEAHGNAVVLRVLGTDISDQALEESRAGIYPVGERTRQTYGPLLERYTEDGGRHQLRMNDDVRAVVRFMRKDILEGSRRHRFELVVCDHVLQYYEEKDQRLYLDRLVQAVQADSWLYVSTPLTAVRDAITRQYPFRALARNLYQRVSG